MDELKVCEHEFFFGDGFRQCVKCFLLEVKAEGDYLKHKKQPGCMIVEEFSDVLSPIEPEMVEEVIEPEVINADDISDIEVIDDNYDEDEI